MKTSVFGRSLFRLLHPNRGAQKQNRHKTAVFKNRPCAKIVFILIKVFDSSKKVLIPFLKLSFIIESFFFLIIAQVDIGDFN